MTFPLPAPPLSAPSRPSSRAQLVRELRGRLSALDGLAGAPSGVCPIGPAAIDRHLPLGGLALGVLHEVLPAGYADLPAAFGFLVALAGLAGARQAGPVFLVEARRGLADIGIPYGPGLAESGLDPARLVLIEAGCHADSLWALEEILRARAAVAVIGCLGEGLDLKASRRLHLAAAGSEVLALLLCPHDAAGANAAATRWRVAAAPGPRDRFDMPAGWAWHLTLSRARNGPPGSWRVEYDHAAHRFGLAE